MEKIDSIAASIKERAHAFETAYRAGDSIRLVEEYFASDAHQPAAYPPGQPPVKGRTALIAMFAGMILTMPGIRLETLEVTAADRVAFEVGRAHLRASDGTEAIGRYTVCWILTDDGWRAKTDFFAEDGWSD